MANCALILKISLAMLAFAANSILCRLALQGGHIDPLSFSSLRLASGALVLSPFLFYHAKTTLSLWRPLSGFYLMVYAVLFSVAYIHLDTGAGALLLFGAVQFAMVIHGLFKGESLSVMRACGLVIALAGIAALLLPGAKAPPLYSALMMIVAGLAWAAYSVRGRAGQAAGASTAANFVLATPMALQPSQRVVTAHARAMSSRTFAPKRSVLLPALPRATTPFMVSGVSLPNSPKRCINSER